MDFVTLPVCIFYYLEMKGEFKLTLVITSREELKSFLREIQSKKMAVGFVPTMGALHEGHGTLIKECTKENDICVVSIFVNPKQFGLNEDLSKYPRPFQKDFEVCESLGVQALFAPGVEEMYPSPFLTQISVSALSNFMCGKYRPNHFDGVATVVLLLLNLIKPKSVYLGQKDIQQVQVIKQMLKDLANEVNVVVVPTIRSENGLALSSRNVYLAQEELNLAAAIPQSLAAAAKLYIEGERSASLLVQASLHVLKEKNLNPQYLELRKIKNLSEEITTNIEEECVLALAQFIPSHIPGQTPVRLIDNIVLSEDSIWKKKLEDLVESAHKT